jgi:hypothetical protein
MEKYIKCNKSWEAKTDNWHVSNSFSPGDVCFGSQNILLTCYRFIQSRWCFFWSKNILLTRYQFIESRWRLFWEAKTYYWHVIDSLSPGDVCIGKHKYVIYTLSIHSVQVTFLYPSKVKAWNVWAVYNTV